MPFFNSDIMEINKKGIVFRTENGAKRLLFSECRHNFLAENPLSGGNCVAERDITVPVFIFFSQPKTYLYFKKKHFWAKLFFKKFAHREFCEIQQQIEALGFTTYDLS